MEEPGAVTVGTVNREVCGWNLWCKKTYAFEMTKK